MQNTDNKMGSQPVIKMLFGISMPIICSMMIQALYNVIESMYVAHISGNALTAVCVCRSRAYVCKYSAEDKYFKFYGIPERKKYANDI